MEDDLPERLNRFLEQSGMDQRALAVKLGVTQQAVSLWLKGQTPRPYRVRQIDALMRGDDGALTAIEVKPTKKRSPYSGTPEERAAARLEEETREAQQLLANAEKRKQELIEREIKREEERKAMREKHRQESQRSLQEAQEEFNLALPPEIVEHTHQVTHYESLPWQCDYLSAKLCADITLLEDSVIFSWERAMLHMATIRQIHLARNSASERYAVIFVSDTDLAFLENRRVKAISKAMGVEIYAAVDPTAAAAIIANIEFGPMG